MICANFTRHFQIDALPPNNSFKPNLLRYGKSVAKKACHAFASTTQVGLTQALGGKEHWVVGCSSRKVLRLRLACSSVSLLARFLFGYIAMHAHTLHALRLPASEATSVIGWVLRVGPAASESSG